MTEETRAAAGEAPEATEGPETTAPPVPAAAHPRRVLPRLRWILALLPLAVLATAGLLAWAGWSRASGPSVETAPRAAGAERRVPAEVSRDPGRPPGAWAFLEVEESLARGDHLVAARELYAWLLAGGARGDRAMAARAWHLLGDAFRGAGEGAAGRHGTPESLEFYRRLEP